jgi:hypothetical protein
VFAGLTEFGNRWDRNAGLFALLEWLCTAALGTGKVALPLVPGGTGALGTVAAKIAAAGALCAVIAVLSAATARRTAGLGSLCRACAFVLLAWFLLLPMAYPWYLLGALPFLACAGGSMFPWLLAGSVGCGYYLLFHVKYHALPESVDEWLRMVRLAEYALPVLIVAVAPLWRKR